MKSGIAQKLLATYVTIIVATLISGIFCLYVVIQNERTDEVMRFVTLPSVEELKEMRGLMSDVKKLTNTWIFMINNKDQERLTTILSKEYPTICQKLGKQATKWSVPSEIELYRQIEQNNTAIIRDIENITGILNSSDAYVDDRKVDEAAAIFKSTAKRISVNDKLYDELINSKNENLEKQENYDELLLNYLYIILFSTILLVILVSLVSLRFSRKSLVEPLLGLNKTILDLANGRVVPVAEIDRNDEIGQMHNAISKMITGVIQKIEFAENIGNGAYDKPFNLLSAEDQLGMALIAMRDNLSKSHEELTEQDKRLIDAQKIAKVGNYLFDVKRRTFQSSGTFDEILGIEPAAEHDMQLWLDLILPEYRAMITEKANQSIFEKHRFSEQYKITRKNTSEEVWVAAIGEHNLDSEGNVISIFGTLQDITEGKTLEIELNDSYNIATEQNKRLSNFSYIVSHNLRMHAVNIHGLLSLYHDSETVEEKEEVISLLTRASQNLDETMHHLNEVVAMQNALGVDVIPQEINRHVVHAVSVLKTQITNKNVIIQNNIPAEATVNYNPAYLESIILNLISNAIKYSDAFRQPVITLDFYEEYPGKAGTRHILQVSDNGIGIDLVKNGHKLFGMYKTFHNNRDAKGIGLFMTKYQIESMGGHIEVQSQINEGTTFKVFIK